jgi:hypothetical protein
MKQVLNAAFGARLDPNSYTVISVVDRYGQPRAMRVKPGSEKALWFDHVWRSDAAGRKVMLQSTDLKAEREAEGCLFLKDAYEAEHWPEGWKLWQEYLHAQHWDEKNRCQRHRPVARGAFPPELLPKSVLAMQGDAAERLKPVWEAPEGAQHPADAQTAREEAKEAK